MSERGCEVSLVEADDRDSGTIEVTMPETKSRRVATVVAWLAQPGERVVAGDPLCRVYFEGQDAEVASPAGGVLRMLAVGAGGAAPTGATLAVIDVAAAEA